MKITVGNLLAVIARHFKFSEKLLNILAEVEYNSFCRAEGQRYGFLCLQKQKEKETWSEFLKRKWVAIYVEKSPCFTSIRDLEKARNFINGWMENLASESPNTFISLSKDNCIFFSKYLNVDFYAVTKAF